MKNIEKYRNRFFTKIVIKEPKGTIVLKNIGVRDVSFVLDKNNEKAIALSKDYNFISDNYNRYYRIKDITSFKVKPLPLKVRFNFFKREILKKIKFKKKVTKVVTFEGPLSNVKSKATELSRNPRVKILNTSITQGFSSYHNKEPFVLVIVYSIFE